MSELADLLRAEADRRFPATLREAADAIDALEAENAALRRILSAVVSRGHHERWNYGAPQCLYCGGWVSSGYGDPDQHKDGCPLTEARRILDSGTVEDD